jgi:hypothetical protein
VRSLAGKILKCRLLLARVTQGCNQIRKNLWQMSKVCKPTLRPRRTPEVRLVTLAFLHVGYEHFGTFPHINRISKTDHRGYWLFH